MRLPVASRMTNLMDRPITRARPPFTRDMGVFNGEPRRHTKALNTMTCMNIPDLVFLTGPLGALVLAPLSVTAIAVVKRPRWVLILGAALTAVVALSFTAYWFLWGQAFDYADANAPVPARLDVASNVAMTLCSIASLALVALAAAAVVAKRRPRGRMEPTA